MTPEKNLSSLLEAFKIWATVTGTKFCALDLPLNCNLQEKKHTSVKPISEVIINSQNIM